MTSRAKIIAANWKMNLSAEEVEAFAEELSKNNIIASDSRALEMVVFPQAMHVERLWNSLKRLHLDSDGTQAGIHIGLQNAAAWEKGAYTGENSWPLARSLGASFVLVGHSERRALFHESDAETQAKVRYLLNAGARVLYCVGETREQRESQQVRNVLRTQLFDGLPWELLTPEHASAGSIVIAYEPVWAIGTGLTASTAQATDAHQIIRDLLRENPLTSSGRAFADQVSVLYGGSANSKNALELLRSHEIDGLLVGGASLRASEWLLIWQAAKSLFGPA